jgi:hypothetical protein
LIPRRGDSFSSSEKKKEKKKKEEPAVTHGKESVKVLLITVKNLGLRDVLIPNQSGRRRKEEKEERPKECFCVSLPPLQTELYPPLRDGLT